MRFVVLFSALNFSLSFLGQALPSSWMGSYKGEMFLYSSGSTPFDSISVVLQIEEMVKDSIWRYKMMYGAPESPSYLVKDYRIVLNQNGFSMDEGQGIIIPMKRFGDCLIDFYSVEEQDSFFMSSILCVLPNGDIEFRLFGGSLKPDKIKSINNVEESFDLKTYVLGFNQIALLKKENK